MIAMKRGLAETLVNAGRPAEAAQAYLDLAQETSAAQALDSKRRAAEQLLIGGPVHIGLGTHTDIDVARIVWPNGVAQAEFRVGVDDAMVAEQRLKGSCPWVFAWDGTAMRFVTDFLWRSPLGLRINAQDTAGVTQTEDWIKMGGDQLAPKDGAYDVRITAELWETHFFDHVSLLVVDHPEGTEIFVDERFVVPPAKLGRAPKAAPGCRPPSAGSSSSAGGLPGSMRPRRWAGPIRWKPCGWGSRAMTRSRCCSSGHQVLATAIVSRISSPPPGGWIPATFGSSAKRRHRRTRPGRSRPRASPGRPA